MAIFTLPEVDSETVAVCLNNTVNTVACFPLQRFRLKHAVSLKFMRNIQDLLYSRSVCVCDIFMLNLFSLKTVK